MTAPAALFRTRFRAMASGCEIAVAGPDEDKARRLLAAAVAEVQRIEAKYSRYRSDGGSIVHRINANAGGWTDCDPETGQLLDTAGRLHDLSGGLFDVTSGILRRAWDFSTPRVPDSAELTPLLALIGWPSVERRDGAVRLPQKGMEIDFGGIGKEYAADCAAGVLLRGGARHGYVNLGGDIRAVGPHPDGTAWRFGVADPRSPGAAVAAIALSVGGLSTSGDYEKFFEIDGVRYCHILNPKSGMPVRCWRSVSVTAVSSLAAGAVSTIAMLKEVSAEPFLKTLNCSYPLISQDGRIISNEAPDNRHADKRSERQDPPFTGTGLQDQQ